MTADRHFSYQYNKGLDRKRNEARKRIIRTTIISALITICLAMLSGWLFYTCKVWSIIIAVILFIAFVVYVLMTKAFVIGMIGSNSTLKKVEYLAPAIIIEITDKYIGALALARIETDKEPIWVLTSIRYKKLGEHNIEIGERVPVACYITPNDSEYIPMPIAWAASDKDDINKAVDRISYIEWNALELCIPKYNNKKNIVSETLTNEDVWKLSLP